MGGFSSLIFRRTYPILGKEYFLWKDIATLHKSVGDKGGAVIKINPKIPSTIIPYYYNFCRSWHMHCRKGHLAK
jgi:hypothetical protein